MLKIKNEINKTIYNILNKNSYIPLTLFILSFVLRIFYVFVDSPYVFHPDEKTIVSSADSLRFNLNPKHFDWPTLTYYLNYPIYRILELVDSKILAPFNMDFYAKDYFNYYLTTRLTTAILGSLGVVFMYLLLIKFFDNRILALFSSVIFSLMPFYIFRSAQSLPDVPMLFFGILSLYFLSLHYKNSKILYLILSSVSLGFSISSKYTGYLFGVSLFLYILVFSLNIRNTIKNLLVSGFFIVFGFLIGTPYAVLDYKTFFISDSPKGALWQFSNVGKSEFDEHLILFVKNIFINDLNNYGFLPQILVVGFLVYTLIQRFYSSLKIDLGIDNKLFVIFVIQYLYIFWSVSGISESSQRAQHFIPVYLYLIIILTTFFVKFSSLRLRIVFLSFFIVLNLPIYLERLEEKPIVKLSKNLQSTEKPENIKVAYNLSDFKIVIDKLGYSTDKFDERDLKIAEDVKYIFSSVELCQSEKPCDYKVIGKEKGLFKQGKVILYEKN
jgi:hypothetical protein